MEELEEIKLKKYPDIVIFGHCFFHHGAEQMSGNKLTDKVAFGYDDVRFMKNVFKFNTTYTEVGMPAFDLSRYVSCYLGEHTDSNKKTVSPDIKTKESISFLKRIFEPDFYESFEDLSKTSPKTDEQALDLMYTPSQRQDKPEQIAFILIGDNDIATFAYDLASGYNSVLKYVKKSVEDLKLAGVTKIVLVGSAPPAEGSEAYHNISNKDMSIIRADYSDPTFIWKEMNKRLSRLATQQEIQFLQIPEDIENIGKREEDKWHYKDYRKLMKWIVEEGCKLYGITEHPLLEHLKRDDYLTPAYFEDMMKIRAEQSQKEEIPADSKGFIEEINILKNNNPFIGLDEISIGLASYTSPKKSLSIRSSNLTI